MPIKDHVIWQMEKREKVPFDSVDAVLVLLTERKNILDIRKKTFQIEMIILGRKYKKNVISFFRFYFEKDILLLVRKLYF